MSAHWKLGNGFAIRDGGRGNIQWFKGDDFGGLGSISPSAIAANPLIGSFIEGFRAVALFLQ